MVASVPGSRSADQLREHALSRWETDGGQPQSGDQQSAAIADEVWDSPKMSNSDLVQLRIRVIALENLVLALLAKADEQQIAMVSEMIGSIIPRVGATPHPLTIHAASQMRRLLDRASHLRS